MEDVIVVKVNGRAYDTKIYDGVQRFVGEEDVKALVQLALNHFPTGNTTGRFFYEDIPDSLKQGHHNAVVNYMVQRNNHVYCGLNELIVALHREEFTLEDWIEFEILHGWSVSGFLDSVSSQISNLGLTEEYYDEEDEEYYEDYSALLAIENPLWED